VGVEDVSTQLPNEYKMKTKNQITNLVLLFAALVSWELLNAQNIGINSTGAAPVASAGLDVSFTNKGLLVPRVALTATNVAGPIAAPATSLFVYNTATAGASPNNVTPGYYYWDGAKWIAFGGSGGKDWSLTGNAGTVVGTNFLGTTDNVSLAFKTNNAERMRILNTGKAIQFKHFREQVFMLLIHLLVIHLCMVNLQA